MKWASGSTTCIVVRLGVGFQTSLANLVQLKDFAVTAVITLLQDRATLYHQLSTTASWYARVGLPIVLFQQVQIETHLENESVTYSADIWYSGR